MWIRQPAQYTNGRCEAQSRRMRTTWTNTDKKPQKTKSNERYFYLFYTRRLHGHPISIYVTVSNFGCQLFASAAAAVVAHSLKYIKWWFTAIGWPQYNKSNQFKWHGRPIVCISISFSLGAPDLRMQYIIYTAHSALQINKKYKHARTLWCGLGVCVCVTMPSHFIPFDWKWSQLHWKCWLNINVSRERTENLAFASLFRLGSSRLESAATTAHNKLTKYETL